jgi:hypothetical protein
MCEQECHCPMHEHGRKFLTKTEKIEKLKKYQQDLINEQQAVQEKIKELNQ